METFVDFFPGLIYNSYIRYIVAYDREAIIIPDNDNPICALIRSKTTRHMINRIFHCEFLHKHRDRSRWDGIAGRKGGGQL